MSDRTVKTTLTVDLQGYMKGMDEASRKTRELGSEAEKLAQKRQAFQTLGVAGVALGASLAAGLGIAVAKFAQFDQAMSFVGAATHETAAGMSLLRDAALEAGGRTVFSATEAANAIEELGKAGVSTSDILSGGLDGALDLAAAGGLGVAESAGIAATALKVFGLQGEDMSHVADVLAAGAGKAMGGVTDLSQALAQSGQVAAGTGLSIEETTAALSAFAAQGLLGSDAGTSFKSMLQRLTPQSAEAQRAMDDLGISAYDAQGNFIGMEKFAGNLQSSLKDLTLEQRNSALATIFGSDAVRAAQVVYSEGAAGIRKWTEAVDDQGYAADTAARRLDNLSGDIEQLGGAFDTALIQSGSAANDVLRFMTQWATDAVGAYSKMPVPLQQAAFWVGAVTGAVALGGGAFLLAVPKVAQYQAAIKELGTTAQLTGRIVSASFKVIGAAGALATAISLIDQIGDSFRETEVSATELGNSLTHKPIGDALEQSLQGSGAWNSDLETAKKSIGDFGTVLDEISRNWDTRWAGSLNQFIDWMDGSVEPTDNYRDSVENLGDALAELPASDAISWMGNLRDEYKLTDDQLLTFINSSGAYREALVKQIDAAGMAVTDQTLLTYAMRDGEGVTRSSADAYQDAAAKVQDLQSNLSSLLDVINESNSIGQDAITTNADYRSALADVNDYIKKVREGVEGYTASLDPNTAAGSENLAMLAGLASKAWDAAEAQLKLDGNTGAFKQRLEDSRQALIDRAIDLGATEAAAKDLADQILDIPTEHETKIIADTAGAEGSMQKFWARWNNKQLSVDVVQRLSYAVNSGSVGGIPTGNYMGGFYQSGVQAFASGGFASGIYAGVRGGIHKFAESEMGVPWETYISGRAQDRSRNLGIWARTGDMLGAWRSPQQQQSPQIDRLIGAVQQLVQANAGVSDVRLVQESIAVRLLPESINDLGGAVTRRDRSASRSWGDA